MSEGSPSKLSGIMKKAKSVVGYGKKGAEAGSSKKGGHCQYHFQFSFPLSLQAKPQNSAQQSSTSSTGSNFSPGCKNHPTEGTDVMSMLLLLVISYISTLIVLCLPGTAPNSPGPNTSGPEPSSFASPGADVTGYGMRLFAQYTVANTA